MTTKYFAQPRFLTALGLAFLLCLSMVGQQVANADPTDAVSPPSSGPLTNLAHLNFLGDSVAPPVQDGHTTFRLTEEPEIGVLWTYADRRDGGVYERVGGGPLDVATNTWGQGAFNTDDLTRAAVVYLRDWSNTGNADSKKRAYELLRGVTYMQTTAGPNAGNVVLWMQPDGSLNPSPVPVETPDPSDSDESYWVARSVWALGEGYEAFADEDPAFAAFLEGRMDLALTALERASLSRYGQFDVADGVRVPAWLIVDGSDATAEAVLGLAAYVRSAPSGSVSDRAEVALERYAEGIATMSAGDATNWPFGSIVQFTHSRSLWHAWSSQMPAGLGQAVDVLSSPDPALLEAALMDAAVFTPYLLTSTGPINGWQPAPTDLTQIAYGVDSRLQSLLTLADVANRPGLQLVAAMTAAWYFGANRAGTPMYDPATGVTFDGLNTDNVVNQNSGAESTIHGLLSMIALDAHPEVAAAAQTMTTLGTQDGVAVVEGEAGVVAGGATVVTPESSWTGESAWSGGAYVQMPAGATGTWTVPASDRPRLVLPVADLVDTDSATLEFSVGGVSLGRIDTGAGGAQGITDAPGSLVPVTLTGMLPAGATEFTAVASGDGATATLDAVLLIPVVSRLVLSGDGQETVLMHNATDDVRTANVVQDGPGVSMWSSYDRTGTFVEEGVGNAIALRPQGFAVVAHAPATTPTPSVTGSASPSVQPTSSPSSTMPTSQPTSGRTDLYSTPGYHNVNGRRWFTTCEPYSQTVRCRTSIWATQVTYLNGVYMPRTAWYFNNLTYLPYMKRAQWVGNPLGYAGQWTAADGRRWRTECDTPTTGGNGCRSSVWSGFIASKLDSGGNRVFYRTSGWVFNNIVRFM